MSAGWIAAIVLYVLGCNVAIDMLNDGRRLFGAKYSNLDIAVAAAFWPLHYAVRLFRSATWRRK